jgi:hypothetical protein
MGCPTEAPEKALACAFPGREGVLIAEEDLWLDAADTGKGGKLLQQVMKQVPITAALKNLVHGLERNLIRKVFQVPSEADPPDLGPADNARPPLGSGCSWKSSK